MWRPPLFFSVSKKSRSEYYDYESVSSKARQACYYLSIIKFAFPYLRGPQTGSLATRSLHWDHYNDQLNVE